ncbi:MAG: hypothetical protein Q4A50_02100 [Bacteroidales bacterium]|nr:hypothetical protein [Bacteroidales bacterium]
MKELQTPSFFVPIRSVRSIVPQELVFNIPLRDDSADLVDFYDSFYSLTDFTDCTDLSLARLFGIASLQSAT